MIKQFTPEVLRQIRTDMEAAFLAIQAKYGINVDIGKMNYDSRSFTSKLTVGIKILSESGEDIPGREVWKTDYLNCCGIWGMKPEYLGRRFKFNGKEVMLIGARPSAKLELVLHNFAENRDITAAADAVNRRILEQEVLEPA